MPSDREPGLGWVKDFNLELIEAVVLVGISDIAACALVLREDDHLYAELVESADNSGPEVSAVVLITS